MGQIENQNVDSMTDEELLNAQKEVFSNDLSEAKKEESKTEDQAGAETDEDIIARLLTPAKAEETEGKEEFIEKQAKTDPISGLKKDLVGERERRRKAEDEANFLRGKLEMIEKLQVVQQNPQLQKKVESLLDDLDDEDVVPYKVVKNIKQETEKIRQEFEQFRMLSEEKVRRENEKRTAMLDQEMKAKYNEATVGKEYAYDTILAEEIFPLLKARPEMADVIKNSANPAETAYRIGLSNRLDISRLTKKSLPETINKKTAPLTIGQAPSGGGSSGGINLADLDEEKLANLSEKEFDALYKKMR